VSARTGHRNGPQFINRTHNTNRLLQQPVVFVKQAFNRIFGDRLSRLQRPTKHIIGHIGDGFYGSNDPTNSVRKHWRK